MLQFERTLNTVDAHVAGEPARVITGGLPFLRGAAMMEKKAYFEDNCDAIRKLLVNEPRGHSDMYCSAFTAPVTDDGDFGLLFLHNAGLSTMCGHATIGSVAVAVETGIVKTRDGENIVRVDTPAGRVNAVALVENSKLRSVTFENVPAFVYKDNVAVPFEGGSIRGAIVYAGDFFLYLDADELGVELCAEQRPEIVRKAGEIKKWADANIQVSHPEDPTIAGFYGIVITSTARKTPDGYTCRLTCVIDGGAIDRSPCGTGTSGQMALLFSRGEVTPDEKYHSISIIGTEFIGEIAGTTNVKDFPAIVPKVTGTAYITGFHQFVLDPEDPLPEGFRL